MRKLPPASSASGPPGRRFRGEIEAAVAEGLRVEDMTLRLTHRDRARLSRDPDTPIADISYAGGLMRFLGVRIVTGGVVASVLERDHG